MKSSVECPHCGSRSYSGRILYYSGERPIPHPGCLAAMAISFFIFLPLLAAILLLTTGAAGREPAALFILLVPVLFGVVLLLMTWAIAGNRKVRYACQVCGTIWVVPLTTTRTVNLPRRATETSAEEALNEEMPDTDGMDLEQPPSPLIVNDLINALQDGNAATRRIAASRLRSLLPALDTMPATRAGVERALAEYERRQ